ncbi:MAG: phenylalanine--tRNA ligase subunit beta, partial [Patescibacteria group bacterium]
MKLPLSWLAEFVTIKETPEKLAERLTLAGIEVESIAYLGKGLESVIVGEIKTIIKHPAADKLQVTKVSVGAGKLLTIVCGAPNIEVGQKVPT